MNRTSQFRCGAILLRLPTDAKVESRLVELNARGGLDSRKRLTGNGRHPILGEFSMWLCHRSLTASSFHPEVPEHHPSHIDIFETSLRNPRSITGQQDTRAGAVAVGVAVGAFGESGI